MLTSVLATAHQAIAEVLGDGDLAIDATLGNGHDTLFLAKRVGDTGRVWGFDVQAVALAHTRRRLQAHGVAERVTLVHAGHETMTEHVGADQHRPVSYTHLTLPTICSVLTHVGAHY